MTRTALAAMVLAAGCASAPPADPAPPATALEVEVRFVEARGSAVLEPRLLVLAGQRARVQLTNAVPYVRTFDIRRGGEGGIIDPVLGSVPNGITLEATATPLSAGEGTRLEYRLESVVAGGEIPERAIELADGSRVNVQVPSVWRFAMEGVALIPDGMERAVAVVPWCGPGGDLTMRVRVRGAGFLAGPPAEVSAPAPAPASSLAVPGWYRMRAVSLVGSWEPGTVVEGDALAGLFSRNAVAVHQDLQWAGASDDPRGASVVEERSFLTDWDMEGMGEAHRTGPVMEDIAAGLLADPGPDGLYRCTLSSFEPTEFFPVGTKFSNLTISNLTIDLPRIHVDRGSLSAAAGERLLVLGPRKDGGCDGVILSFRPGATGPAE